MTRRLLPRFRQAPNPPSIPELPAGKWTRVSIPADLAKLDYGPEDEDVRSRVQSIPSPWARMLLFKNALSGDLHPARVLVENELLDGIEFLWGLNQLRGAPMSFPVLRIDDLIAEARSVSQRASDFSSTLVELMPTWKDEDGGTKRISSLTLALLNSKVILGSSPFTILFTAEDAAGDSTGQLFRYASGGRRRRLKDRPPAFQQYLAKVVLPQLMSDRPAEDRDVDWVTTRRLVARWLEHELEQCGSARVQVVNHLQGVAGTNWLNSADQLSLTAVDQAFGGVRLFKRTGGQAEGSRWLLRVSRSDVAQPPLVIDQTTFDGVLYEGAPQVTIGDTSGLDRAVLPRVNLQYPWVDPERDWFADRLLQLDAAFDQNNVISAGARQANNGASEIAIERLVLPLRPAILRYFAPDALAKMVKITVQGGSAIEVALTLSVGAAGEPARELTIRKRYDASQVHRLAGPTFAIWPAFTDERWHEYALFRFDRSAATSSVFRVTAIAGDRELKGDHEQRTDSVAVSSFKEAPEALAISSTIHSAGSDAEECGIVLPRYRTINRQSQTSWHVGMDFGTSNTVITVRPADQGAPVVFKCDDLLLPLSELGSHEKRLLDGYFFPADVRDEPFGTAVLHFRRLSNFQLQEHGLGVRVNIPFSGYVEPDDRNAVTGDLKWSAASNSSFLTKSFLRHALSLVIAHGVANGIDPRRIRVSWAYPRAFTTSQVNQLRGLWDAIGRDLTAGGNGVQIDPEPIDESSAILRHFVDAGKAGVAGRLTVLLDVGGGTSDIAAYSGGKALLLDSLMLGGRNLTGQRLQGATHDGLRNPFVAALAQWARDNQLTADRDAERALTKYLEDGQDHLAFTYLLGTRWFQQNGQRFTASQSFHDFQALVLYFYGALFHYVGLSVRDLIARGLMKPNTVPYLIVVAGNGSRYLHWLTDLVHSSGQNAFTELLSNVLARAASPASTSSERTRVELSENPKREVALGLVAGVRPELDESAALRTPLVGESIKVEFGGDHDRPFAAADRFEPQDVITARAVPSIAWAEQSMEIQQYHQELMDLLPGVASYGAHWHQIAARFRSVFSELTAVELQEATRARLHFLTMREGGFLGSVFALEAAAVLETMMSKFFTQAQPTPGLPGRPNVAEVPR